MAAQRFHLPNGWKLCFFSSISWGCATHSLSPPPYFSHPPFLFSSIFFSHVSAASDGRTQSHNAILLSPAAHFDKAVILSPGDGCSIVQCICVWRVCIWACGCLCVNANAFHDIKVKYYILDSAGAKNNRYSPKGRWIFQWTLELVYVCLDFW